MTERRRSEFKSSIGIKSLQQLDDCYTFYPASAQQDVPGCTAFWEKAKLGAAGAAASGSASRDRARKRPAPQTQRAHTRAWTENSINHNLNQWLPQTNHNKCNKNKHKVVGSCHLSARWCHFFNKYLCFFFVHVFVYSCTLLFLLLYIYIEW